MLFFEFNRVILQNRPQKYYFFFKKPNIFKISVYFYQNPVISTIHKKVHDKRMEFYAQTYGVANFLFPILTHRKYKISKFKKKATESLRMLEKSSIFACKFKICTKDGDSTQHSTDSGSCGPTCPLS